MKKLRNYTPAIGWGIFIFIISTIPGKDIPHIESPWDLIKMDKLVHMSIYGFLIWQILRGYLKMNEYNGKTQNALFYLKTGMLLVVCASIYGFFIEWVQENYCEDRAFEYFDGLANTIGACVGCLSFYVFRKMKDTKNA
jgi:hypothetical protein